MFTTTDWSPFLRKSTHIFFILFLLKDQFEAHVHEDLLNVYTYYGSERTKDTKLLAEQDVVLTTYQTLSSEFSKVWPYIHVYFFLEKSMLESGGVQQNIRTTAAKHTAEFPSHTLSGYTQACFPLATHRALCALQWNFYGKIFKATRLTGHLRLCEKDWDWVGVVSNCAMGLFLGRHHQSWLQEKEFWKRVCFIHWLLRGCAGNWIEIGPPRQTSISNSTSTTKHKLKHGRFVWKFSRFPGKFVSVKAVTHTVLFFLEAKDLFLREKGSNKTQLFFEDI